MKQKNRFLIFCYLTFFSGMLLADAKPEFRQSIDNLVKLSAQLDDPNHIPSAEVEAQRDKEYAAIGKERTVWYLTAKQTRYAFGLPPQSVSQLLETLKKDLGSEELSKKTQSDQEFVLADSEMRSRLKQRFLLLGIQGRPETITQEAKEGLKILDGRKKEIKRLKTLKNGLNKPLRPERYAELSRSLTEEIENDRAAFIWAQSNPSDFIDFLKMMAEPLKAMR